MYTKFKELGYYDHKQDIPIEFKPLKYLTLEEYISLLPKTPRTAPQAVLVELDRQGKIEITGSKSKRLSNKLTKCESDFLDALESQNDTAFEFIYIQ